MSNEENYCHYSDLPSPLAYVEKKCTDYDSMGNHGRFPKSKKQETNNMKRLIQKIALWFSFKFSKSKRKGIWDL